MIDIGAKLIEVFVATEWSILFAIILSAFLDSLVFVGLFINGAALFSVSLFLLTTGQATISQIIIFAYIGSFAGDQSGYLIGKIFGNKPFNYWPLNRKKELYPRGESFIKKYGICAVILGRFVTPLRSIAPMVCAVLNMPYRKFFVANVISCFAWVLIWSLILWLLASGYDVLWLEAPVG